MSLELETRKGIISTRQAVPGDAAALRELRLEALANHPIAFAADYALTENEAKDIWVQYINGYAENDSGVVCVAEVNGLLIGMAGLVRGKWPKTRHSGIMWGVYVRAEWRGLDVAGAIINACSSWGRDHGLEIIKLGVTTINTAAIRCYDRCGFTIYGTEPKVIYYKDEYYDEFLMVKFL